MIALSRLWQILLILVKVSRPPFWIILPLAFCLGLSCGERGLAYSSFQLTPLMLIQILMLTFPICLFTFGFNDVFDIASDQINPRKSGLEGIRMEASFQKLVKLAAVYAGLLFICSSLAIVSPANLFFSVTLIVLSYVYSAPPWRLKTRPPLDMVSAGILGFLAPFGMGFSFVGTVLNIPLQAYCFTFCVMGFHAFSTIFDYTIDRQVGDRTFAVVYGKRTAALIPAVLFLCSFFLIRVDYIRVFLLICSIMSFTSFIFPSEKLARYFCLTMYLGAVVISGFWIIKVGL